MESRGYSHLALLTVEDELDAAGLAQFEKIRLAAVLQLDDKWFLAKAAVTTHRCKQLLLTRTPERNACEVPGYCVPAREDDGFSKHNLELTVFRRLPSEETGIRRSRESSVTICGIY